MGVNLSTFEKVFTLHYMTMPKKFDVIVYIECIESDPYPCVQTADHAELGILINL